MDENTNQDQQNSEGVSEQPQQNVHIFGMNVNGGASGERPKNKEEWKAHKEEWKAQHRAQREEWKAHRDAWREQYGYGHHSGPLFGGLIILLIGVLALLYTMGLVSPAFWHAVEPLWPTLVIFWGASMILGRHWAARIVLFILAAIIVLWIIAYGLIKTDSPLVSSLSPTVVRAIQTSQLQQPQ